MDRNKPLSAAALAYDPTRAPAPRVTAQGRGLLAERIVAEAQKAGVPIRQDRDLVELLLKFDLNQEISPDLYAAVAEILAYLYRLNEHRSTKTQQASKVSDDQGRGESRGTQAAESGY